MTSSLFPNARGPAPKRFRQGTHRLTSPEETLDVVGRLLPLFGITRVANVTGLDVIGIPVVMVTRPNSRSLAVSQGKGVNLAAAKASGIMESVELFHAERAELPLRLCSYAEMRLGREVIDMSRLPRLASSLYTPQRRLLWAKAFDLLRGRSLWVPYEMVHMNYTLPLPMGSGCFAMSSNGLASGNHLYEALCHAICELIERDATTLWRIGGRDAQERTRLDLSTVDDELCREVLDRYDRAGVYAAVWDVTADLGVPTFYCVILDREINPWRPLYSNFGAGCHPARNIALLRALTEAAQSRLTMISSSRDDVSRERYEEGSNPERLEAVRAKLVAEKPARSFRDAPDADSETFDAELEWLLRRLEAAGLDSVAAVDLSLPGLGPSVVRAIIPGLEPSDEVPGYEPGSRACAVLAGSES